MKKKILFVTQQLNCGGVEKALINLLNLVDRDKVDCELLVIDNSGEFKDSFPEWLTIHEYQCPHYVRMAANYYTVPKYERGEGIKEKIKKTFWKFLTTANWITAKGLKKNISYRFIFNIYKKYNDYSDYDMLVDFHGYGVFTTYWTAYQKTKAKKVSWVHEETIYQAYDYISCAYKYFDRIFANCIDSKNNFIVKFPYMKDKTEVYYNYLDVEDIKNKAEKEENDLFKSDGFKITSVGSINGQKLFGRAVDAAHILKNKGYSFKWIIVGDGKELEKLRVRVTNEQLSDYVEFVGFKDNPYAYIKQADLYVQTSRAEGFCTTISEAVILGKPVVSTKVGGVDEQLDGDRGGVITDHSPESIALAIADLIDNAEKLVEYSTYNNNKELMFDKEIEKLYKVLD